jgi:flagellar biosynthesis anti-sigma factor FlgM
MKVGFTNFAELPDSGKTNRAGQAGSSATTGASTATGTDQTSFTFDPSRVQTLAAQVIAQPEIRDAKVQSLQQAIGNNNYSVSAGQIADALASDLGRVNA